VQTRRKNQGGSDRGRFWAVGKRKKTSHRGTGAQRNKMKKIRSIMKTALDKFSDIFLPVFVIGMFIYVFYHELTKEKPIDQAIIGIFHNIRENIIIIIISIALGTFLVFIFMKIKRNKNNIVFSKMNVLYIFLAATIWMTLILIRSKPFYPATLLIPLVFLLLIIQGITEYYKINNETLYVKKGIMNKTEVINIKEIALIGLWTDNSGEGSETFVVIYLHNNKIFGKIVSTLIFKICQ
jgi:magnesium-transporting ATPase (P-type)